MKHKGRILYLHSRWLAFLMAMSLGIFGLRGTASAATATTAVSVSAPTGPIGTGQPFTASVVVAPGTAIAGIQFNFSFDASLASVSKVEEGGLLKQSGASSFFNSGTVDNQAGKITGVFGAITSPGKTASTKATFATITLTAKTKSGNCPLVLEKVVVGDITGNSVPVSVVGGTATIDRPPTLSAIGNKSIRDGMTLTFTVSAIDDNGDALTYSASNLPTGATFNAATRTFSWTPSYSQIGVYTGIRFQVSDGKLTDFEDITITVDSALRPDVNSDGSINVLDMIRVGQHWSETGAAGWIREDINEDGTVSGLDATLVGPGWTG